MPARLDTRVSCLLWIAVFGAAALGTASAQTTAQAIDSAAFKARIAKLPATAIDLNRVTKTIEPAAKPVAAAPAPPPSAPAKSAYGKTPPAGIALYVPLPADEAAHARALLAQQLAVQIPETAGSSSHGGGVSGTVKAKRSAKKAPADAAVVPFKGVVRTQTRDAAEVVLLPLAKIDDPLRFNAGSKMFEGRIAVGLVELGYTGPAKALAAPIGFQVLGGASTDPDVVRVASTSPPLAIIKVSAPNPHGSLDLEVLSNVSAEPVKLRMPVERARLTLEAKAALQGWGLESTDVVVAASDGDASKGEIVVLKSSPLGDLVPNQVTLGDGGIAHALLRSESIGATQVQATSTRLDPDALGFAFEFPLRFLIAGAVGGLGGGVLKRGIQRRGKARRLVLELGLAVVTGVLVFGLFTLGVNLTGFDLPQNGGEILVAVVAALGALLGAQVLTPKAAAG